MPLLARGWRVEAHIVVSLPSLNASRDGDAAFRRNVQAAFQPRTLSLVPSALAEEWIHRPPNERCAIKRAARWHAAENHGFPVWYNLRQWFAIGVCYDAVERVERASGRAYDWLVRVRSDMAFFEDVPLASGLDPSYAYTLSNGMSSLPHYRCMNDHAFLCPRRLCRPFFKLTELWTSPFCRMQEPNALASSAGGGIFLQRDRSLMWAQAPPASSFALPLPPQVPNHTERLTTQWYLFARYSDREGRLCGASEASSECCGLLREVAWPSSIGRSRNEGLDCAGRLAAWWAVPWPKQPDFALRPSFQANVTAYIKRCELMQLAWQWGHLASGE